jgi:hypothetical protein
MAFVFLHVAPPNVVSQRYDRQVNSWVYPFFEQNWKLFAPNPDSVNRQISARSAYTASDGSVEVKEWFDLTAVDKSAVRHNVFPSHTHQNMLRRAWAAYPETHGGDDQARSERAVMVQKYLRNIAAERARERDGAPVESIQLRVVTLAIGAAGGASGPRVVDTRLLPWWKVSADGN